MTGTKDFSQGSIFKGIFIFSVPLIFTNMLQVLFNMADVAVVGRFAGDTALGAVGSTPMLIFFCTGIIMGIGQGVNAIAAYYIGAKKSDRIRATVHTSAILCTGFGLLLMVLCIFLARIVLSAMNTKPELIDKAVLYFRIFCIALPFAGFFNFGNGILNAEGNTKSPLKYLTIAGILNVILNLVFVIFFRMDVAGVALASVISQFFSSAMIFQKLSRRTDDLKLHLNRKYLRPDREITIRLLKVGVPSGLQNGVFAFANMFIQMGVNSFESAMVIANSASSNADPFVYNIMGAFYSACSTFIGQNYGAGKKKRILKSYWIGLFYSVIGGLLGGILFLTFGPQFISLFTTDPHVIDLGFQRLKIMACCFWIAPFMDNTLAASRGLGKTFIPSLMILGGSCVFRIIWIYTVFAHYGTLLSLFGLFPVSWIITATAQIIYFSSLYRKIDN